MKFHVPDMSCGHCKASIEKAIAELDAGADVTVHLDSKTVDIDSGQPSDQIIASLQQIGFQATAVGA